MGKPKKLSPKLARFAEEYPIDLNATKAAERAGFSAKTARQQGQRALTNVAVAAAIQAALMKRSARTEITQDRVLTELGLLAFSDVMNYEIREDGTLAPAANAPPGAMRAISSIKYKMSTDSEGRAVRDVEIRLWDKPGPLKLAGRHVDVKGFSDRTEITGKNGGPIMIAPMTAEQAAREIAEIEAEARGELPVIDVTPIEPKKDNP